MNETKYIYPVRTSCSGENQSVHCNIKAFTDMKKTSFIHVFADETAFH